MRPGTPLPATNCERTVWPGPFGATRMTSTSVGQVIVLKWTAKPWEKSRVLPLVRCDVLVVNGGNHGVRRGDHDHVGSLDGLGGVHHFKAELLGDFAGLRLRI